MPTVATIQTRTLFSIEVFVSRIKTAAPNRQAHDPLFCVFHRFPFLKVCVNDKTINDIRQKFGIIEPAVIVPVAQLDRASAS